MNQYSELLYYLKGLAELYGANTVTKDLASDVDLEKQNIYPLVNISVDGGNFTNGQTIVFNVVVDCLAIRDINKEVVNDKFWDNDNEVDNHNDMFALLNKIWTHAYRDFTNKNITSSEDPTFDKITFEGKNLLDGWALTFTLELPNTTLNLCP